MEPNIPPIQRSNPASEVREDELEEESFTSQPMERTSYRYTSSTIDVEGYQWVVNTSDVASIGGLEDQMCGSGGVHSPGTLEAVPSQQKAIIGTSGPWASFQKQVGDMTERSERARRTAESVERYLEEEDDGNIIFRAFVSNARPPFQALFEELERWGLAPPAPPAPPAKQEDIVATQTPRETPHHRETEQSLEEILYLPSCG